VLSSVDTSPVSASHSSVEAICKRSVRESPHRSATVVILSLWGSPDPVNLTPSIPIHSHSIYTHPLLRLSSWLLLAVVRHESHGNTPVQSIVELSIGRDWFRHSCNQCHLRYRCLVSVVHSDSVVVSTDHLLWASHSAAISLWL
jgi:hypothetical protein